MFEEKPEKPSPEEYQAAVFRVANLGVYPESLDEARYVLELHLDMMEREKRAGKPLGETCWLGYMVILRHLAEQIDIQEAKADTPEGYTWLPYTLKTIGYQGVTNDTETEEPNGHDVDVGSE